MKIRIEPHVESIVMPENLKIAEMVNRHRKMCQEMGCDFDYHGIAFGQSPFQPPPSLIQDLGRFITRYAPSMVEGVEKLRAYIDDMKGS